jgi:hypothetical protein
LKELLEVPILSLLFDTIQIDRKVRMLWVGPATDYSDWKEAGSFKIRFS